MPCVLLLALVAAPAVALAEEVRFEVRFDSSVRADPATGRVVVFLIQEGARVWNASPADGPFWRDPQPMFGADVQDVEPGGSVVIGPGTDFPDAFPHAAGELAPGKYKAQAVFDGQRIESVWRREPGNLFSDTVEFEIRPGAPATVALKLSHIVDKWEFPRHESLREFMIESKLLGAFRGEPVHLNAGVVLPLDYDPSKKYAAIYEVPGFSGRHDGAAGYIQRTDGDWGELRKRAFIITLDPESPNGHTLFCDSRVNGPWGRALVEELIPALEKEFPLIAQPWARIVTGHSSGGWSSLWLGTQYPDTFGACWSSGPDPVDLRRLELIDIYSHENAYVDAAGTERPAARFPVEGQRRGSVPSYEVTMTVRQENGGEGVLGPGNTSGQQWDSWMACWGTADAHNSAVAKPLFDAETGKIDREEAKAYEKYDIRLLLAREPDKYAPIFARNVRLICGQLDNFYLNEAVTLLKEELDKHDLPAGPGYIKMIPNADHGGSLFATPAMRAIPGEMVRHLQTHGSR
jgi:hypothetical protein